MLRTERFTYHSKIADDSDDSAGEQRVGSYSTKTGSIPVSAIEYRNPPGEHTNNCAMVAHQPLKLT